mgnify:CR=1 FL=1
MLKILTDYWWVALLRGALAIIFGMLALCRPGLALIDLIYLFGYYALCDGVLYLWLSFRDHKANHSWWLLFLLGLISIIAGAGALSWPGVSAAVLLLISALRALASGALEVLVSLRVRQELRSESLLMLDAVLSVLFGLALLSWPGAELLSLLWFWGLYATIYGFGMVTFALRLRKAQPAPA